MKISELAIMANMLVSEGCSDFELQILDPVTKKFAPVTCQFRVDGEPTIFLCTKGGKALLDALQERIDAEAEGT